MRILLACTLVGTIHLAAAQQSPGAFDAPVVAVDVWSRIDELVDLDLDGHVDGFGIYTNQTTSSSQPVFLQAKLHRNDGAGHFTTSVLYQWPATAGTPTTYRSAVGDTDGDGHPDVITLVGNQIWVVESRPGAPVVRTLTPLPLNSSLSFDCDMKLVDVTGDGRAELVVCDTFNGLRVLSLGATTWSQRGLAVPNPSSTSIALLEANGDGNMDIAVLHGSEVRIYPATQAGVFGAFASFLLPPGISSFGLSQGHLCAGDLDGDLDADIIVFSIAGQYCWIERTGPAQFVTHASATGGPATHLYDFDGDGDLDGTCCGGSTGPGTTTPNYMEGAFEIAENLGGGVFAPAWLMPSIGPFHLAGCADLDGDGRPDLAGGRCVWFGSGRRNPVAAVLPSALSSSNFDADGDGDPDMLDLGNALWTNRGDGTFSSALLPSSFPPAPAGSTWAVRPGPVDFDGDDDVDLFVRLVGPTMATHWFANAGGGFFVDRGAVTPGGTSMDGDEPLHPGDLDGDGDVDLVHTEVTPSLITRTWWQHNGTVAPGPTWPDARVIGVADFTHDGRADVLLATYPFPPAQAWMNLTLAVAQPGQTFALQPIAQFPSFDSLGIVDHDGDGNPDLVVLDAPGAVIVLRVWLGDGLGQFTAGPVLATLGMRARARVFLADVDGNGLYDVVAGPAGYPEIVGTSTLGTWVVRQVSPGQFESTLYPTELGRPIDVDGDGDIDLLGRALVRNRTFEGVAGGAREQFGDASAGTGGARPTIGAVGPFRVGTTMQTRITGGLGQGFSFIAAGLAPANPPLVPLPGFTVWLDNPFVLATMQLAGGALAAGEGSSSFPLFLPPIASGFEFYEQVIGFDPAGVAQLLVHSQALRIQVGW
ncbi:MAG TPA: VCBS repeat-containing protein [Planctomycetota bacterium]|nr:VCBS repeat-containing protein [Planctomycetota bacterium]